MISNIKDGVKVEISNVGKVKRVKSKEIFLNRSISVLLLNHVPVPQKSLKGGEEFLEGLQIR